MHRAKLKIRELYDAVPPGLARACQFALDIAVLAGAFALAYLLRFDFVVPRHELGAAERQLLVVVSLQAFVLAAWGVHRILWRYVTLRDAQRIAAAICLSALICFGARLILPEAYSKWRVPLTVTTMDVALALCGIVGMRCIRRVLHEAGRRSATELAGGTVQPLKRVILLGAGHVGRLATQEIARRQSGSLRIIGFVDDDPRKRGTVVNGVRVLGSTADLPLLVRAFEVDQVVITIGHASRADLRRLVELCDRVPVMARVMPGLYELLQG
jgi:FlaA1/EpsC-like NDP-sugar epimerase